MEKEEMKWKRMSQGPINEPLVEYLEKRKMIVPSGTEKEK